jgi:hypothetical protein
MKMCEGSGGTASPFLTLAPDGGGGQFHALAALPLGKDLMVSIGQEAGWAPELGWMLWRKE